MTDTELTASARPLLESAAAEAAWLAVEEIAADLLARWAKIGTAAVDWGLAGGTAGQAVFFAYLDRARPGHGYGEVAFDLLDQAVAELGRSWARSGLYGGFAGVGWAIEHLREALFEPDDDPGEPVAAALLSLVDQSPWRRSCDLIGGLVGFGVYALERGARAGGREALERVVARLAERAEAGVEGIAWFTAPELLPAHTRELFPGGYYNAGVAHGTPGMIALLAAAARQGVEEALARGLCEGAVSWLLAHRLPAGSLSLFPYSVPPDGRVAERPTRLAWCYGDLGIATALLSAARSLERPDWEAEALAAGHFAAARPVESSGVADAGLCHGAAGVAHLFHRLFAASGEPRFAAAARRWFGETLALRRPGQGVGGFLAHNPDAPDGAGRADPGFLEGVAGIGLVLLAALTPIEPAWDRVLLASPGFPAP